MKIKYLFYRPAVQVWEGTEEKIIEKEMTIDIHQLEHKDLNKLKIENGISGDFKIKERIFQCSEPAI